MAHYNPFRRTGGFGEERQIHIEWATNEDPITRAERIAHDKATQRRLPSLFQIVVPRTVQASRELRQMRVAHPPMPREVYWTQLLIGGDMIIYGFQDSKCAGYCDQCNSWGKGCGPKVNKDGSGSWQCWHGKFRPADVKWGATHATRFG